MAHAEMAGGRRASGGHEPTNEGKTTMEQLTGLDATFLYLETPSLHMHVSMAAMFDPSTVPGGYSFDKLRDLVSSRLELAPIFRRRLVEVPLRLGHPYWVDDPTFDIEYHIRRGAVPAPGGVEELAQFVGDVCSRQLDRSKPLWEMYIVEGLRGGQIAVVTKIHHCTIDGVSGAELLSQLFDLEPEPPARPAPDAPVSVDEHLPSDLHLMAQSLGTRLTRPARDDEAGVAHREGPARRAPGAGSGTRPRRVAPHDAAHLAQRRDHAPPARGLLLDLPRRRQAHQAGLRHHAQRRRPGGVHRRAAAIPPRRRRVARRTPRGDRAGVDGPDRRQPTGRQQGLGDVRGPPLPHRRPGREAPVDPREHQGGQGGAQRARCRRPAQLGRARHSERVLRRGPCLYEAQARRSSPAHPQSGDLQRAGTGLPALSGGSGDGGRLPARPGHGRGRD